MRCCSNSGHCIGLSAFICIGLSAFIPTEAKDELGLDHWIKAFVMDLMMEIAGGITVLMSELGIGAEGRCATTMDSRGITTS